MNVFNMIGYIKQRVFHRPLKIILPIMILIVLLVRENANIRYLESLGFADKPSIGDIYISLFWGVETSDMTLFYLPYDWLVLMLGFIFVSTDLISKELETTGITMILQSGRRSTWIIEKYIIGMLMVVFLFSITIFLCVIETALCKGIMEFKITEYTALLRYGYSGGQGTFLIFIVPLVAIITLCILQITAELLSNSTWSFLFIIGVVVLSGACTTIYLPGNGTMLIRGVLGENHIEPLPFMVACAVICVASIRIGWIGFYKRDLLGKLQ